MVIYIHVDCILIYRPSGLHAGIHLPAYACVSAQHQRGIFCMSVIFVFDFSMKRNLAWKFCLHFVKAQLACGVCVLETGQ